MSKTRAVRILVTGGGTGGHVSPALAVIGTLRAMAEGADWTPVFRYIGSAQGVEGRLAREADVEFVGVATGKLRRARTWRGYLSRQNVRDALRVPLGVAQAVWQVRRFRPDVVLATGGYVSVPPVVAAWLWRIPVLIHEQTVQMGLANRIAARFAARIALTFDRARQELPRRLRGKAVETGNPVRAVIFQGDPARARARFGFDPEDDGLPLVYITGGVQGAQQINRAVEEILPGLLAECRVIHQCGRQAEGEVQDRDRLQAAADRLPPAQRRRYRVLCFVGDEIGDVFALADLVVGRSGAGTVAEVCALGKPALFVPLVPTGGDEQTKNARRLADCGAAVLLPAPELEGGRLLAELQRLLADPERRKAMGEAAGALARPDAARDLAKLLLGLAGVAQMAA